MNRKLLVSLAAAGAMVVGSGGLASAGSIDYLSNQSAPFLGSFSRNASTDGADIVAYNPAGVSYLSDGLHLHLSNQTVFKEFTIDWKDEEYSSDVPSPAVPSFFLVYKNDPVSFFFAFTIPAGGGSLTYDKGVPFLYPLGARVDGAGADAFNPTGGFFEGSSMYLAPTIGAAYKIHDAVSISAAMRLVYSSKTYFGYAEYGDVHAELDAEKTAFGVGGIFGVHFRPIPQLDIGLRAETETALEFETSSKLTNITPAGPLSSYADGAKEDRNLPAVLSIGVEAHPIEPLSISVSFNYYLTRAADNDEDRTDGLNAYVIGYDDDYDNGYDIAASVSYQFIPELRLSLGYNHTDVGGNKDTYNDFEYSLNSNSVGMGFKISPHDDWDVHVALSGTFYDEDKNEFLHLLFKNDGPETFSKWAVGLGLAVEWRPEL